MGGRAATAGVPSCGSHNRVRHLRCKGAPYDSSVLPHDPRPDRRECRRMIGVALADWLLDEHAHDRLGDALSREAEQLEEFPGRGGLTEAVDADDGPCAPDVLVPEVRRPRFDSDAR